MPPKKIQMDLSDQDKIRNEALKIVRREGFEMKRKLDEDDLMGGLKHASTMLSEMRTSMMFPKTYYELYMQASDELRHLESYLLDQLEKHGTIGDLYELVQYTGNIVPRLYLLITVGAVFVKAKQVPTKDVLRDLVEMCRGVQHPLRGLFLRNYLLATIKGQLPEAQEGEDGTIMDSINFILLNFSEMNKLWVRMQHQGHSRDRKKREEERLQLRLLVGTNLVRLSQLEGVDTEVYKKQIIPHLLEQVVSCRDPIAQEYLMESIIQVFPDEFHLVTLEMLLGSCAPLHHSVNIKGIVVSLIDRLVQYFKRNEESGVVNTEINLYKVFSANITKLLENRKTILPEDAVSIQISLLRLTIECYPSNLDYVNELFQTAKSTLSKLDIVTVAPHSAVCQELVALVMEPFKSFPDIATVLKIDTHGAMFAMFESETRHDLAVDVARKITEARFSISSDSEADVIFSTLLHPLVSVEEGSKAVVEETEVFVLDMTLVARVMALIKAEELDTQAQVLNRMKNIFTKGSPAHGHHTIPTLVFKYLALAKGYYDSRDSDDMWEKKCVKIYSFVRSCVLKLCDFDFYELGIHLFLQASLAVSATPVEKSDHIAYDYFTQVITSYEEEIGDSKKQVSIMNLVVGTLNKISCFSGDNYSTLSTKCALLCSKLIKKPDQCRGVCNCANLFWSSTHAEADGELHDGEQVMKCFKKALKIAKSCAEPSAQATLYVEIFDACLAFKKRGCENVSEDYLSKIENVIKETIGSIEDEESNTVVQDQFDKALAYKKTNFF
eukprot:m.83506 g.83506  ORF g.83506 m.83506 type:complete len:781 (-) comp8691_c2_seq1:2109-4451(-)